MDSESLLLELPYGSRLNKSPRSTKTISAKDLARYFALAALGILPYANTFRNGFVYDDQYQVLSNPFVRSFHYLPTIFTTSVWDFQVKHGVVTYYRPMMSVAYLLFYQAFGPVPYGFHLANVLLNAAVIFLLFAITRRLFDSNGIAWTATVVFALHPAHTEVVAWIAALPDLQLTVGLLAGFWFYLNLCDLGTVGWRSFVGLCIAYIFSLLSKEPAVAFPVMMLAFELIRVRGGHAWRWQETIRRQAPLWTLTASYFVVRFGLLRGISPNRYRSAMPLRQVALSAGSLFGDYANKLIWPAHLQTYYSFVPTVSAGDPRFLTGAAWIAALALLFIFLWYRHRSATLGVVFLVAPLLPVLDAKVMASNVFAERYLFLPSVGFCWLVAEFFETLWKRADLPTVRIAVASASLLICVGATLRVISRNSDWRDEITLFRESTKQNPENSTLHADLGAAYWNVHDESDAVSEWRIAIARDPNDPVALDNLGLFYLAHHKYDDAAGIFRRVIATRPAFPTAHIHLAATLQYAGDAAGADSEYRAALDIAPLDWGTHNLFANFCLQRGDTGLAEKEYEYSLAIAPNPDALDGLARFRASNRDSGSSEKLFRESLKLDPYDYRAHLGLAAILAQTGRIQQAIEHYEAGLKLDPADETALAALKQLRMQKSQ